LRWRVTLQSPWLRDPADGGLTVTLTLRRRGHAITLSRLAPGFEAIPPPSTETR